MTKAIRKELTGKQAGVISSVRKFLDEYLRGGGSGLGKDQDGMEGVIPRLDAVPISNAALQPMVLAWNRWSPTLIPDRVRIEPSVDEIRAREGRLRALSKESDGDGSVGGGVGVSGGMGKLQAPVLATRTLDLGKPGLPRSVSAPTVPLAMQQQQQQQRCVRACVRAFVCFVGWLIDGWMVSQTQLLSPPAHSPNHTPHARTATPATPSPRRPSSPPPPARRAAGPPSTTPAPPPTPPSAPPRPSPRAPWRWKGRPARRGTAWAMRRWAGRSCGSRRRRRRGREEEEEEERGRRRRMKKRRSCGGWRPRRRVSLFLSCSFPVSHTTHRGITRANPLNTPQKQEEAAASRASLPTSAVAVSAAGTRRRGEGAPPAGAARARARPRPACCSGACTTTRCWGEALRSGDGWYWVGCASLCLYLNRIHD